MAMSAHQSARPISETWFTPPAIIEALGGAESFDLDPCSHVDRPFPTARRHLTIEDNSLLMQWHGRVWLNPPYSTAIVGRFMARLAEHGIGTALIFARTETDAFFRYVWERASGVLFIKGRLHFCHADGTAAAHNSGAPSVLIAYGEEDRDILAAAPIDGQFLPLQLPAAWLVTAIDKSWRTAVSEWLAAHDGPVKLDDIYRAFARHPKARRNPHWREKVRQVLQRGAGQRVERGVWQKVEA
jgi:hypothetical protein